MGSDGCRGMHWHPANAKQDKQRHNRSQDIILASVRGDKLIANDVEVGTWPPEIM